MIWVSVSGRDVRDENGKGLYYEGMVEDISARKQVEDALRKRLKELACLYVVSRDMHEDLSVNRLCRRIIEHLVLAMQFPEMAVPVIELDGRRFTSERYGARLSHGLHAEIRVAGEARGHLWVYYSGDKPFLLPEEQYLLNAVADALGRWLERKRAEESLRDAQEFVSNVLEHAPVSIYVTGADGRLQLVNRIWEQGANQRREAVLGHLLTEVFASEVASKFDRDNLWVIAHDAPLRLEETVQKPNGERHYFTTKFPLHDAEGRTLAVGGISIDITERKQGEEALRASEAHFRELADSITDVFFEMDRDLRYIYWNKASETLTGIPAQDALGKSLRELLPDTPETRIAEVVYLDVIQTQQPQSFVNVYRVGDKHYFHEISAYPSTRGISVFAKDITARKRAEAAIQASEARYRELFNHMHSGVAVYEARADGEDFVFTDFNQAGERIEKARKENLIGKSVVQVFPGVKEIGLFDVFRRVWKTGKPEHHPISLYKDERLVGWRENYVYKLPSGEIVAVYNDLTEQKQAEAALRESEMRYRAIVEDQFEFVDRYLPDGTVTFVNPAMSQLWGHPTNELLGRNLLDSFNDVARADFRKKIRLM